VLVAVVHRTLAREHRHGGVHYMRLSTRLYRTEGTEHVHERRRCARPRRADRLGSATESRTRTSWRRLLMRRCDDQAEDDMMITFVWSTPGGGGGSSSIGDEDKAREQECQHEHTSQMWRVTQRNADASPFC
jgi:hypothetical protein